MEVDETGNVGDRALHELSRARNDDPPHMSSWVRVVALRSHVSRPLGDSSRKYRSTIDDGKNLGFMAGDLLFVYADETDQHMIALNSKESNLTKSMDPLDLARPCVFSRLEGMEVGTPIRFLCVCVQPHIPGSEAAKLGGAATYSGTLRFNWKPGSARGKVGNFLRWVYPEPAKDKDGNDLPFDGPVMPWVEAVDLLKQSADAKNAQTLSNMAVESFDALMHDYHQYNTDNGSSKTLVEYLREDYFQILQKNLVGGINDHLNITKHSFARGNDPQSFREDVEVDLWRILKHEELADRKQDLFSATLTAYSTVTSSIIAASFLHRAEIFAERTVILQQAIAKYTMAYQQVKSSKAHAEIFAVQLTDADVQGYARVSIAAFISTPL
jgi:hypothetical protein